MFRNQTFSFEALRAAGFAVYGGADLGEVIVTAQKVRGAATSPSRTAHGRRPPSGYTDWLGSPRRWPPGERPRGASASLELLPDRRVLLARTPCNGS